MSLEFFLKQVDPIKVAKEYLKGTLRLPPEKIKLSYQPLKPDIEYGDSYESMAYEYVDKNGKKNKIISTGHNEWAVQSSTNSGGLNGKEVNSGGLNGKEVNSGG